MLAEAAGLDQRADKKMRPRHCTKKNHPGSPEVTFLGTDTSFAQTHPTLLKNTVILLEPYCGTITAPGLPVLKTGILEAFPLSASFSCWPF